jgi:hypothetical protein
MEVVDICALCHLLPSPRFDMKEIKVVVAWVLALFL